MKILYVTPQLHHIGYPGLVLLQSKMLQNHDHQVAIVTTDGNPFINNKETSQSYSKVRKKLLDAKGSEIEIDGIPVYPVHCVTPKFGMYSPGAKSLAKKIIKNFDVIHIYSFYHHLGIVFYKIAHENKIPFFISAMGTLQKEAHNFYKRQKSIVDFFYTRKMISQATCLHSIGSSEDKAYKKFGGDPNKIRHIENGVVLENFQLRESTRVFERISVRKYDPYLLYLGRINPKKGLELLLQAYKKLHETNQKIFLVIAGSGSDDYLRKIKEFIKALQIEKLVTFAGNVTENEKLELLQFAKLFCLTSYSDLQPRAVQEALTMGIPVVITKSCDFPEVEEYKAGIIADLNVDSIHHALITMLNNEEDLSICSKNAQKLIRDKYLMEDQVRKFENMYLEALKNKV